jgi:hypothetical protein
MKKLWVIILIGMVLLTGCGKIQNHKIKNKIISTIDMKCQNTNECTISIKKITDFDWDRLVLFNEGASRQEINSVLGFEYRGDTDLKILTFFLYKGKIVYHEEEDYDPEKPSKLFVQYPNPKLHHMKFSADKAIFKAKKEKIDGEYYYTITPIQQGCIGSKAQTCSTARLGLFFRLFPRRRPSNQKKPESGALTVAFNRRGPLIRGRST